MFTGDHRDVDILLYGVVYDFLLETVVVNVGEPGYQVHSYLYKNIL